MNRKVLALVVALFSIIRPPLPGTAHAALLLGFDFQTGVPIHPSGSVLQTYAANFGDGMLFMDGSQGSSAWDPQSDSVYAQLSSLPGTTINTAGTPFSTVTTGYGAVTFRMPQVENGGVNSNGFHAVFAFDMSGYQELGISYAFRRQNNNAYTQLQWDYSVDGINWQPIDTHAAMATEWTAFSLPIFDGLDDQPAAYVRVTFSGASISTAGKGFYMDNFQFNAQPIPEPASVALLLLGPAVWLLIGRKGS
ncbi:MAG TPA: hypothetical protein VNQ90_11160 [Chthoniobacteraceae bacterium]|nr:hypothetical protein [Chthoniobacteraceae bacterium]